MVYIENPAIIAGLSHFNITF